MHDVVDALGKPIAPNMVFCVDIGIYAEDLGIGFRVEDNCLVTPTGAENLSASVPRTSKTSRPSCKITGEISMKLILPEQITATQYAAYLKDWGAERIVPIASANPKNLPFEEWRRESIQKRTRVPEAL